MRNALVVADDLTGAMDTGHGFAGRGRGVRVRRSVDGGRADSDAGTDADVLVVDTDSRDADNEAAAAAVARAVEAYPAGLVYKKVDSTLRGNVAAEVDAALAATGAALAVVAPAFPATGRTTEGGRHLVDGTPLAEAGYGVAESDLREYVAGSEYPVAHLDGDTVDAGPAAVGEFLADRAAAERPPLVVCDARTDDHLEAIAAGAASLDATPLYVGSGGLAAQVALAGEPPGSSPDVSSDPRRSGVLAVVGSVNERTLAQLDAVDDEAVVALDPAAAVGDPESAGRAAAESLSALLDWRERAVVTAARSREDVAAAERAAADLAEDATAADRIAADRVAAALAAAARATVEASPPAGLVLTGGDTAEAVLDALDVAEIALTGESVAAGVPEGRIATGPAAGTRVVTKAGGFGGERVILNCLDTLGR
ncbi:ygbK domain-containing protein [Halosimplex carlsbadense 2-9-1]|uniref:YgbK domain-containing protein n=1 Tax=Halosimplex carlsbadense 2-9-1 TaxID=797114 RepID=M0D3K1_9EURY|nr:four-carbon acid sugar kinase family protein [Halosimplex carlsbadense]ELZ29428.1 ygbK domain-containing protein [Halosimplex carlsbadense 2-9-1]